jgi:hypothetical protein
MIRFFSLFCFFLSICVLFIFAIDVLSCCGFFFCVSHSQNLRKYDQQPLPRIKWLDKLSFRRIEKLNQEAKTNQDDLYLIIELENFAHPIVFDQKVREIVVLSFFYHMTGF